MKTHSIFAGAAAFGLALLACSGNGETVQEPGFVPQASVGSGIVASATGSGHVKRPDGSIRKFTINAVKQADGSVTGNYDLELGPLQLLKDDGVTPPLLRFHGTITCMTVIGNSAYLGGDVRSHQNGELFFGRDDFTGVAIELIDHGEGRGAVPARSARFSSISRTHRRLRRTIVTIRRPARCSRSSKGTSRFAE